MVAWRLQADNSKISLFSPIGSLAGRKVFRWTGIFYDTRFRVYIFLCTVGPLADSAAMTRDDVISRYYAACVQSSRPVEKERNGNAVFRQTGEGENWLEWKKLGE